MKQFARIFPWIWDHNVSTERVMILLEEIVSFF